MNNNTYSEVYNVLEMYGSEYINKLPKQLYLIIKEKRNLEYNPKYEIKKPLYMQDISKEALALLTFFFLDYWCESETEKEEIEKYLTEKENIKIETIEEINKTEDIVLNQESKIDDNIINNDIELIAEKVNPFKKFLNKIKNIFKKNK